MLQLLLKPGIGIISRLSIARKFFLIFVLYLIPVVYVAYYAVTKHQRDVVATQQEIQHLALINQFKPLFVNMAKSRGLTNAFLNGNSAVRTRISNAQAIVDERIDSIASKTEFKELGNSSQAEIASIKKSWQQLKSTGLSQQPANAFNQYSTLIAKTHILMKSIMESGSLLTDSEAHTSFLIQTFVKELPQLIEVTGQTRGTGAGVAAKGQFTSDSFIALSNYTKQLSLLKEKVSYSFDSAAENSIALTELLQSHQTMDSQLARFLKTTSDKVLTPDTVQISSDEYFALGTSIIQLALTLNQQTYDQLFKLLNERKNNIIMEAWLNIISSLALILGAIYLFACFYKNMLDSISRIEKCVNSIAGGDLTTSVNIQSSDEMKNIGRDVNQMIENTKSLVSKVLTTTNDLVETASSNSQSATATSERIYQQNIEVEQVATAMNQMSATVQEVATNAEQTALSTASADKDSKAGYKIVEQTTSSISELAKELEEASTLVNELQESVNGISSVLDVIQGIADQTNLLALNAAIEAARAGESGRGFAVVADEVRTLASKTQESTEEIRQMIQKLQASADLSVKSMKSGNAKSQETVIEAKKAGNALKQISESVSHISLMGEQIASASTEQSTVAEEINRSIMSVKDISELTGKSAENSAKNSQFLDQIAGNLKELVAQFKV